MKQFATASAADFGSHPHVTQMGDQSDSAVEGGAAVRAPRGVTDAQ